MILILAGAAAAVIVIAILLAGGILGNIADKDYFELGVDQVPSVKLVLGETRDISSSSSSTSNGIQTMVIKYSVETNQANEMRQYTQALVNEYGFVATTSSDFSMPTGNDMEFARESDEDGFIVMVSVEYGITGYTLTITRGKGTLTLFGDPDPVVDDSDFGDSDLGFGDSDLVEILIPAVYLKMLTEEDIFETAREGGFEAFSNPDGSFTYILTYDQQLQLLYEYEELLTSSFQNILDEDMFPGLMLIEWTEDFEEIYLSGTEEFFADDGAAYAAVLAIGFISPFYQVYQGRGNNAQTRVSLFDYDTDNYIISFTSPDDIADDIDW